MNIMTKQERQKKEKKFKEIVKKGIEWSFLKQKEVFEKNKKTKALYEEIKKRAKF